MGTFEKLGILVIVVIIVMILAVAIYQWGGTAAEPFAATPQGSGLLTVNLDDLPDEDEPEAPPAVPEVPPTPDMWPGGIPKRYVIQKDDKLWVIVVRRWALKESFIAAIVAANPRVDVKRLRPGKELSIPDPSAYRTSRAPVAASGAGRTYEVQGGDTLESIAHRHLGKRSRWHEIVDLNPSLNPDRLMEGQEILLPLK